MLVDSLPTRPWPTNQSKPRDSTVPPLRLSLFLFFRVASEASFARLLAPGHLADRNLSSSRARRKTHGLDRQGSFGMARDAAEQSPTHGCAPPAMAAQDEAAIDTQQPFFYIFFSFVVRRRLRCCFCVFGYFSELDLHYKQAHEEGAIGSVYGTSTGNSKTTSLLVKDL